MGYVLGVDGGGSKTHAIIASDDGEVVGFGAAGGSNIYDSDSALSNAIAAVSAARSMALLETSDIRVGVFSMAGADWPEDFAFIREQLVAFQLAKRIVVVNDAIGGLRSGVPQGPGVAVICGTGVATAGVGHFGELWHSGFWQGRGGAMDLARSTLNAIYRVELGLSRSTTLTERVLDAFALPTVEEVLHAMTCRHGERPLSLLTLPRILLDEANQGDETAHDIVQDHGHALGDYAIAAARKVHILDDAFRLVMSGGVFRHHSHMLVNAITSRVHAAAPNVIALKNGCEPVLGAVVIALHEANIDVTPSLFSALFQSVCTTGTMYEGGKRIVMQ